VIFGNSVKAKTLLIVRLQGFIRFDSLWCDPAGIGSAPQNPEAGPEPFTNRTHAGASVRIPEGIKQKNLTFL